MVSVNKVHINHKFNNMMIIDNPSSDYLYENIKLLRSHSSFIMGRDSTSSPMLF